MTPVYEFSIIIETYNLHEGTDRILFQNALRMAALMADEGQGEVIVADSYDSPGLKQIIAE